MRKKALLAGISVGVIAAVVVILCALFYGPRQPRYHGTKLREWLDVVFPASWAPPAKKLEAETAVREIGEKGLPWLIAWLKADDSGLGKMFAQRYYGALVPFGIHLVWTPAADHNAKALAGFKVLGRQAEPAIPQLVAMATNAPDNGHALRALRALCDIGSERAFDAVMSLKSTRPQFTEKFLRNMFISSNPEMSEYAKRKADEDGEQR